MAWAWEGGSGKAGPPRASGHEGAGPIGAARKRTILVVDDDPSILYTVTEILTGEGHDVIRAESGEQALAALSRTRPSLILLDMRMPHMDGWAVARALRERDISVPIVVMTAAENAERWAQEIGAAGYLAKPFELDELLRSVERD